MTAVSFARGADAADEWGKQSRLWEINDQVADVDLSMGGLVERMIALRPKTLPELLRPRGASSRSRSEPIGPNRRKIAIGT